VRQSKALEAGLTPAAVAHESGAARRSAPRRNRPWAALAAVEVLVAAGIVVADVAIPTLVILVVAALSLLVRRRGPASLGLHRLPHAWRSAAQVLGLTVAWTVLQVTLFLPLLEHVTGEKQDVTDFAKLQGDLGLLVTLLVLTWTYAAVGEELVFRGYLPARINEVLGRGRVATVAAVLVPSLLFGLLHTEQGLVGVVATFLDAIFFSVVRLRYRTVWASSLAHGFNNTLGMIVYFLVGPVYGLW
jgi:membrane protease YdiL (CAAX protease family)